MTGALLFGFGVATLVVGIVCAEALKQIVRREYDSWAPALACSLVRLAGWIHRPRAREWQADLAFLQHEDGESGLWLAAGHLAAAPRLTGASLARRLHAALTGRDADPAAVDAALLAGSRWMGVADTDWFNYCCDNAGSPIDQAYAAYRLVQLLVGEPEAVTFVGDGAGGMRGFVVEGGNGREAVCVDAAFYARHRSRVERAGRRVVVVTQDVLRPLVGIADVLCFLSSAAVHSPATPLTLVFEDGDPYPGYPARGSECWGVGAASKKQERLARRALHSLRGQFFAKPGFVISIGEYRPK